MRPTYILLFAVLVFASCRRDDVEEPDIIVSVKPEFTVDLYEQRDTLGGTPRFGLWVESLAKYACPGYTIRTETATVAGVLTVRILEVEKPAVCVGDSSPARQFVPLGAIAAGNYPINIVLGEAGALMSEGMLTVGPEQYELSMPETRGFDLQNRVLRMLPARCLWGYVLTPVENQTPQANAFINDLKTLTGEPQLEPGYYGYFTVSGSGSYFFHRSIAPPPGHVPFLRRLTATTTELQGLLHGYRDNTQIPLSIRCWSSEGPL